MPCTRRNRRNTNREATLCDEYSAVVGNDKVGMIDSGDAGRAIEKE
jgi:hypothetical protein